MTPTLHIRGHCPACRNTTLFRTNSGHVTCSWIECTDPTAADRLLNPNPAVAEAQRLGHGYNSPPPAPKLREDPTL